MSDEIFNLVAKYLAIIIPVFGGLIGLFFLIPKFNPKDQYKDLNMPISKASRIAIKAAIAFVIAFGGVFGILYLIMWLDQRGIKLF